MSPLEPLIEHKDETSGLSVGEHTFVAPIRSQHVPSSDYISALDAIEEIHFIGYPAGLYDTVNLTPIARRGITATPLQIDYQGKPVFLIDAAVFPGSSGSPVFLASNAIRIDKSGKPTLVASRMVFLGVIAKWLRKKERGRIEWTSIPTDEEEAVEGVPTYTIKQALNLGVVYRSSMVLETIEDFLQNIVGEIVDDQVSENARACQKVAAEPIVGYDRTQIRDLLIRHQTTDSTNRALPLPLNLDHVCSEREDTGSKPAERWFSR